jgi:DnaJ-class molecular chaperone
MYHPDHAVSSGLDATACSQRTAHILEAYAVLHDRQRRAKYDASGRK